MHASPKIGGLTAGLSRPATNELHGQTLELRVDADVGWDSFDGLAVD